MTVAPIFVVSIRTLAILLSMLAVAPQLPGSRSENLNVLVDHLSWESVGGKCVGTVWTVYPTGREALALIGNGKGATEHLLSALTDPEKAVAAHLILCEIWKAPDFCGVTTSYPRLSGSECGVDEQPDIEEIQEAGSEEVIMMHNAGVLQWKLFGKRVKAVDPETLGPNRDLWCKHLKKVKFNLASGCR